jgi:uncharacterized membrane protein
MRPDTGDNRMHAGLFQVIFVLLWLAALIAFYFGLHKPAGRRGRTQQH